MKNMEKIIILPKGKMMIRRELTIMTEGQLKFQQLQETARHNYEMERLGQQELSVKQQQAEASKEQAAASTVQAAAAKRRAKTDALRSITEEIYGGVSLWNQGVKNALDFIGSFTKLFK